MERWILFLSTAVLFNQVQGNFFFHFIWLVTCDLKFHLFSTSFRRPATFSLFTITVFRWALTEFHENVNIKINWILIESNKFHYEIGKSYAYRYSVDVATYVNGTDSNQSRLHLTAKVYLDVISKCDFTLRVILLYTNRLLSKRSTFCLLEPKRSSETFGRYSAKIGRARVCAFFCFSLFFPISCSGVVRIDWNSKDFIHNEWRSIEWCALELWMI